MITPARTIQQRQAALDLANEIRIRRAQLKVRLRAGEVSARDLILDPPGYTESMKVVDALLATPKVGPVKTAKLLNAARVSPAKRLGGLSERQRFDLVALLPHAAIVGSRR